MSQIVLTGYIYRDPDGMFVSHCNELNIDTWAETVQEAQEMTAEMIDGYFAVAEKLGTLDEELRKLEAHQSAHGGAAARLHWKASQGRDDQFHAQFLEAAA